MVLQSRLIAKLIKTGKCHRVSVYYLRASYAANRYRFGGVCMCICASVCESVQLSAESLENYWLEIDVTW